MTYCIHSWCDKDRNLMDSWKDRNNLNSHYLVPCEHFEYGNGKYDKNERKRKKKMWHINSAFQKDLSDIDGGKFEGQKLRTV